MINIAICDDNFAVIEDVKKMIHQYEKNLADTFSISDFSLPSELFLSMQKNSVDIVFLDLEFHQPDYDGILWASRIHAQFPDCLILILTAYEERFREGYIARAFRFMTKPLIYQEFEQNMNACLNELKLHDSISIIQHGTELSIPLKNIIYSPLRRCRNMHPWEHLLLSRKSSAMGATIGTKRLFPMSQEISDQSCSYSQFR